MAVERIQELIGLMQKNLECSICLELMKHPVATKCEHYFCSFCLTEFLGKKRSVPCPLCKQPITKRSLTEKGELNNIVSALSNLITAFQQDSGITYSPPGGPQTFFPCTPDTINSKPESCQVKCRRNMRRSSRSSKQTGDESLPSVNEIDTSVLSEDGLAVPHIPSVSTGNLKPTRRRKSPLTRQGPSCLTSVEADMSRSGQSKDRPTSKTRAAVTATCSNTTDQLLHYLDENSCGLQKETQDSKSVKQTSDIPEPKNSGNTKESDHQLDNDQEARGTEAQRKGEEDILISPAEHTVVQNNEVVRTTEESQEYDANMSGGGADFHIEQSPHTDLKTSHSNKGELNNEQLDVDCKEKLSQRITRRNVKNRETRPQADKENLTDSEKPASCNRKNEEHKNTGLAFSSQNSSDEGSVSSTQQFQRPLPVVTKTYSKRFGGRNGSEKKVEDWIACLPTDLHHSGHQPAEQNEQKTVLNECGQDQSQTMGKEGNASLQDNDANPMNSGVTETGNDNEKCIMRDTSRLEEGNQAPTTSMPEEYDEFVLTPPVRKKRIFKRKSAMNDQDSRSPTLQEVQENSPPADPYAFVVGHTPVAKSKKRGRSKAKEKTEKPPVIQSFSLNPNEKKTVRFSGAPLEMIPTTSSFIAENREEQTQADGTIIVSDRVNCSEKPQDLPPHDVDAAVEGTDAVHTSGSPFVRPGTRSRLKTQSKTQTTETNSRGRNKEMPQQRNTRRRMTNKDQKEDPEAEKIREEQTEQLASWIGQAEDYDLLFSTQEAQACIESMHTEENREKASMDGKDDAMDMGNDEAIALREEDENSNDGLCLVGPIGDDGPSTMDISAQSANFDMIVVHPASDQNAAEGNIKLFDSANFKPNAGNDAAQTGSATSVAMHSKPSDTPETKERENSTCDMNFPSRWSPSGSKKKVDAIPETQLSTLESPALSGIVLPSPAVGAAFPKFSTPIIQSARQRRSCKLGQGVSAGGVDGTPQKESIPAEANRTTNCRKQDGDMATASVENSASACLNKTSAGDDPDHLTALSLNPTSPTAKKAKHKLSFPSSVVKVKSSLPEQEGENAKGSPSPRDSACSMTGRLRRQKRGSSNRSPIVTAIPSTFTEDSSAHVTCVSASTEDQQEQLGKEMALASAQQPPSSREEPEEVRDESEAVATVASSTDGTDKAERKGKHQSPVTEKIKSTVHRTGVDPDGEGDSSSTEDLDVDPAEHEFEEADLSLQLEEVQHRYSTGQGTQDEENASQNFSDGADVPSEVKMSLPSESNAVVGENYEQTKKRKMTPFNKPHTDDKVDMNLESAETQSPPNLSSVTQIPETLDVEESTRKTKTVPASSQTQDGRKEGEHDDSQKSHKTTLTDSSTLEVNSQFDSFSLTQAQQVPHSPSTESSKNVITSSSNGDNQSFSASVSPSQSVLQPFGGEKQSAAGQSSLCSDSLALSATPSQSILQPIGGEKLPMLEVEKRSAIGPSSLNSDNQTSSASATPSQSILQPIGVEKQSAVGQSEKNIQQSESTTPNQSLFQSVKANQTVSPKYTSQSEGKLGALQRPGGNEIPVHPNCTAGDQPVTGNKKFSDEAAYTGCTSRLAVSEVDEIGEKKEAHKGEVCGSDDQAQPKLLVQDTQDCGATEDQSLSILSQHIVQESVPEHKESSQPFDGEMHPQTNAVDLHAEGCPTPALKSPGQKLPVSEDEFLSLTPSTATQNQNVNSPAVSLSPSVACPSSRKRKLPQEDNEDHTASVPVFPKIPTPELLPSKSPSAASSKVISSAPPRATSLLSDSDDGDAVPIVRRTKRKCFSLEGSPLKRRTSPSKKRGRYCRKQKNLSEEFDKEADSGAKQTAREQNLSQLCGEYTEGNAKSEKVQNTSLSDEHGTKRSSGKLTKDGNDETSIEGTNTGSITELMSEKSAESVKSKDRSKTTPLQMRKKTVRGLAQRKAELSDSDAENGCGHVTPRIHPAHNAEKSESQIGTNMDKSDGPMFDTKGQLTDQRKVLIHVSDDEDPMEVDDMGISADSGRKNLIHTGHQNQTEAGPSHLDSDESISVDNQPLVSHGSAGSADKPIMITQSSDKSETQRPSLEIQSSVPASADDATIPAPSFDLRFDEDEEDDESATPRGDLVGQGIEKTGNNMAVSQENKSSVGKKYAKKAGRTTKQNEREKNEKQSCSEVEQIAERKRTEGTDEAVPTEILNQNEAGPISSTGEVKLSGGSEKPTPSSEEEEVVVMKKKKPAVIDSDSDSESDQGSDVDSEASQQLNFTSSSAVSSQSEVITTQERSKMESELERLRREIAEMETKLHGQSSSRSDSTGDRKDSSTSARNETLSALALDDDSSGDEMEESSGEKVKRRRRAGRSSSGSTSASRVRRPRRYQRISSDEDDDEQDGKQPRQQIMDTYLCSVKVEGGDPVTEPTPVPVKAPVTPAKVTSDKKAKNRDSLIISDEDSSDLFLSPLSPSPPPPIKHTLARAEPYERPQSAFSLDSPSSAVNRCGAKFRQALDFATGGTDQKGSAEGEVDKHSDSQQDTPEPSTGLSGKVKKIPESQFSASDRMNDAQEPDLDRTQQGSLDNALRENLNTCNVDDVDSSGSPLPSPLIGGVLKLGENKENVGEESDDQPDDDDLPRWRRKKCGFISSGLDQEKSSLLRKLAEANECKVYSKFNDYVTHVVIKTEKDSRVCERTLKYFQGIACQCWVLSFDWVVQSLSNGSFVPEKKYEIRGDTVKGDDHKGPRLSRLSSSGLLVGFAFAPVGVSSDMSKKELTQLLTLCGGEVVEDPWDLASHQADHKLVLRCVDSEASPPTPAEIELFNGQYKHFGLVTVAREWILDSISTHCLQPLKEYVFNTCPNLRLPL